MNLKETRLKFKITIEEAAKSCGVPYRTYLRYEKDDEYGNNLKRKAILEQLIRKYEITEEKGILSFDDIKEKCNKVFNNHKGEITFCYLFGSYAKGYAKENSDVDLLISTDITGFDLLALIDELRECLSKKVELIRLIDLKNNIELISEIMKDGIKIYG